MKYLNYFLVFSIILALMDCAPRATKGEDKAYVPSFRFTPDANTPAGSAEVTFAVVNASYAENQPWMSVWPFTDFSRNMALDFQQILNARGFTVKGPFGSYDELTFPDKKGSDLVLQPTLEVRLDIINPEVRKHISIIGSDNFTVNGQAAIGGRITLALMESLSKERMWFKSIEISREVVVFEGEKKYDSPPPGIDMSDPGIAQALGPKLEALYTKIMQSAWNYLDPEEMKLIKQ